MAPVRIEELKIDHIVDFSKDNTTFAAGRENGNNHLRIFLVNKVIGTVYTRNGRADSWEELSGERRQELLDCIENARRCNVPVYQVNGLHMEN